MIKVGFASNSEQFIGYWGMGLSLEAQLKLLLSPTSSRHMSAVSPPLEWSLSLQPAEGVIVELAAAGIQPADVWVKSTGNSLTLGRDAFGRVTLYWVQIGEVIWYGTRLQLLLLLVENPQISILALYSYSCFSYVSTPETPIEKIMAIPPGVEQTWQQDSSGKLSFSQAAKLPNWYEQKEQIKNEQEAIITLRTLLKLAIAKQTADLGSETVGVFLSGGLDSSIVAALLVQQGLKVCAYSLDFGTEHNSEYPYAEQVAQWLQIPLVKVEASPKQIKKALVPTIKALDLPFGDGVTVPLYLLNQVASQETKTVFNGEGGDQLFAGWTNKPLIAASIYQGEHPEATFVEQYLGTFHRLWGYQAQVFSPAFYSQIQDIQPEKWLETALNGTSTSLLHRLRRATLMLKGAQNIQPRATNLAFTHGLQVRSLFCDHALSEWTFQLAGELCLKGSSEKYILKKAVESWLPAEIVWRTKRGMGVPLTAWCLHDFWRDLGTWLNPAMLEAEGIWQKDLAKRIALGELGITGRRIGEILWLLIVWQLWRKDVLGESLSKSTWNHPFWLPYEFWRKIKQF